MAYIFDSGITFAAPTGAWARLPLLALAMIGTTGASPPQGASLHLSIEGLRNTKGAVMLCLTRQQAFLKCAEDPGRLSRTISAASARSIDIKGVPPGEWSLLLVHDENRNGKLDKMMGMPREGFGFSRNPVIRFGPPSYGDVRFALPPGGSSQSVKVMYLL